MTAIDIINQIEVLPLEEQAQVIDYIKHRLEHNEKTVQYANDTDASAAADNVIESHSDLLKKLAR